LRERKKSKLRTASLLKCCHKEIAAQRIEVLFFLQFSSRNLAAIRKRIFFPLPKGRKL
jgi:hypothetical protein